MEKLPETESAGGLVLGPANKVLLVQEFGNYWSLPRGHLKEGEDSLEAAKREIYEETGITELLEIAHLGSYMRSTFGSDGLPNYKEMKRITHFAFKTEQIKLSPRDKDITDIGWFAVNQAKKKFINKDDLDFFTSSVEKLRAKGVVLEL